MVTSRDIKVGAFVLLGLLLAAVVVFLVGDERQLFSSKVTFHSAFDDVQGLKRGSTIRMGGIDIGSVESVGYSKDPKDPRLHVKLRVVATEARRIRRATRARIESKGFLGDKAVNLSSAPLASPVLPIGGFIPADEAPQDLQAALNKVGSITTKAETVMKNLEATSTLLADESLHRNVKASAESLSHILATLDNGPGYASRILNDAEEAERISRTITNLERATAELDKTLATVSQIVERVEKGPGLVHEVVYGEQSAQTVARFGAAADEIATLVRGVREGNGLARSVLLGDDKQQIAVRVEQILNELHGILADVRAGKGTLGALLVDPSVYEDLKVVLGNIERNKALRALVRYSIQQSEPQRKVTVTDPAPSGP